MEPTRISTPAFRLYANSLLEAIEQGKLKTLIEKTNGGKDFLGPDEALTDTAVGLRWNMHHSFGFPRQAFKVYRRSRRYHDPVNLIDSPLPVIGYAVETAPVPCYLIGARVVLAAGESLHLTPLSGDGTPMNHLARQMTTSGIHFFRSPHMRGMRCIGTGILDSLVAITMDAMLRAPDWELVQFVGLPLEGNPGIYSTDNQGYLGNLKPPQNAAFDRLHIGALLHLDMPGLGDATVPNPAWSAPHPADYLNSMSATSTSILKLIKDCLAASDDSSFNPNNRQPAYKAEILVDGVHQDGIPASNQAVAKIPVVATGLLSAGSDQYGALGLGYGTTDFPRPWRQESLTHLVETTRFKAAVSNDIPSELQGYDYMVTNQFVIRPFEFNNFPGFDALSEAVEFAALSETLPSPQPPSALEALTLRRARPAAVDQALHDAIKLRFAKPLSPQGYGLVMSLQPGDSKVLNSPYEFQNDAFPPYTTSVITDPQMLNDVNDADKYIFVEPGVRVPFSGSETHKFFVAGLDVMGRWSAFAQRNHVATAPPPQLPGIMAARLVPMTPVPSADQATFACTLEVELTWDWADRRPRKIQLTGQFFPADGTVPAAAPAHLFHANGSTSTVVITLDLAGVPSMELGSVGTVVEADRAPGTPAELHRYLWKLEGFMVNFPSGMPFEVAYAVYARGLERVRPLTDFSPYSPPIVARLADPRPPLVNNLPADVIYTALPDATRMARGVLAWAPSAGALNYNVWEANETAIRDLLAPYLAATFPGNPAKVLRPLTDGYQDRATQLRDLLADAGTLAAAAKVFSKLNHAPVGQTQFEISLPSQSDVLFLYRISALGSGNLESGRSSIAFMAVPRLIKPEAPRLSLRLQDQSGQPLAVQATVLPADGPPSAGFELYRIRKRPFNSDPGAKGLPLYLLSDPGWTPVTVSLTDTDYTGKRLTDTNVQRSWKAYYYQAVAIGQVNPAFGQRPAESDGSTTEPILVPPAGPPTLVELSRTGNAHSWVVALRSDLPFFETERGGARITVHAIDTTGSAIQRTTLLNISATDVETSSTDVPLASSAAVANDYPLIKHRPEDAGGLTRFSIGLPTSVTRAIVRVTDPIGRYQEIILNQ